MEPGGDLLPDNAAAALCYILGPVTGVLFLTLQPYTYNRHVRFHAWQSILFNVSLAMLYLVLMGAALTLSWLATALVWFGMLFGMLGSLLVWLYLLYQAFLGKKWKL